MSMPATTIHTGVLTVSQTPGGQSSRLADQFHTGFVTTCGTSRSMRDTVVGATDGAPFPIALGSISKVRVFAIEARGGQGVVKLTSAAGVKQAIPLGSGSKHVLFFPAAGSELTAIEFVGTADLEYLISGDVG